MKIQTVRENKVYVTEKKKPEIQKKIYDDVLIVDMIQILPNFFL